VSAQSGRPDLPEKAVVTGLIWAVVAGLTNLAFAWALPGFMDHIPPEGWRSWSSFVPVGALTLASVLALSTCCPRSFSPGLWVFLALALAAPYASLVWFVWGGVL